ncbi:MAG: monooxygenase [Deltaproteobacteria bacterium]|nr:monooxygenase [Deltaproteobacteria bacterium]
MPRVLPSVVVAVAACEPPPTYYQDVKPILDGRCVTCHQEGAIAPFALTTYDEARARALPISAMVQARLMPPWLAGPADVTYRDDPSLTPAQIQTLRRWAEAEAPEGDSRSPGPPLQPVSTGLDRVDLEVAMPEPYTPILYPDEYRCFPLPWPLGQTSYVTGFDARPGNPTLVHHVAVYLVPPAHAALPVEWDGEDEAPGYTCFGGPSGDRDLAVPIQLLAAWTPGFQGISHPEGIGIAVQPQSVLVMQLHYQQRGGASAALDADQTSLRFRLGGAVDRRAVYAPWLKLDWVLGAMPIPAGDPSVEHSVSDDPRWFFDLFIDLDLDRGFLIHGVLFHMHKLGVEGSVTLVRPNGERITVLNIPRWDFDWQREYHLTEPVAFLPGDEVELRCRWDNSAANQPLLDGVRRSPADVNWGEGSDEEMCVADLLITAR